MYTTSTPPAIEKVAIGKYRWTICALIFFATTINYLDRQVISLLKSTLEKEFTWSETDYANLVTCFQLCYALGMIGAGRLIDKLGTKIGYALATALWSLAALGHGLVTSTLGFFVARGFLGVTESGNFPAAIKTVAEWFPKKERALATGIFNSGTNIGAIVAPLSVPFIAQKMGWKAAFVITGLIGFVWLIFWFVLYEVPKKQKKLSKAEFDYIHSDKDEIQNAEEVKHEKVSWGKLLQYRQTWAFAIGKGLTDPMWWFFLFWLPDILEKQYGLSSTDKAFPVAVAYTIATLGSIGGGWLPLRLIKNGSSVFAARKRSMLIYACCALPVITAQYFGGSNMWVAVCIISIAMAAHQAWSANIFTVASDLFPKHTLGAITGIGGMFGAVGGIIIAKLAGALFDHYKALGHIQTGYSIMFVICGSAYLVTWTIMHLLVPKMRRVEM